ncbi:hypothetical protein M885DRAFT_537540 [Pelagophyceae sp. CCMP2097]|nr:hypothetical protein M885DRAFT_537540 [Pelagophyceae sp. CCMP2097]
MVAATRARSRPLPALPHRWARLPGGRLSRCPDAAAKVPSRKARRPKAAAKKVVVARPRAARFSPAALFSPVVLQEAVGFLSSREKLGAGVVSRHFRWAVDNPGAWSHVDFLEFRRHSECLALMKRLWRVRPRLAQLRLHLGHAERHALFGLLRRSVLTGIRRIDVTVDYGGNPLSAGVLEDDEVIDIEAMVFRDPVALARAALLDVAPGALESTPGGLAASCGVTAAFVELCPSVEELRVVTVGGVSRVALHEIGGIVDPLNAERGEHRSVETFGPQFYGQLDCLSRLARLVSLETNFDIRLVAHALPLLPALKTLKLSTGSQGHRNAALASRTLEHLDCSNVGKGLYLSGLDCPRLRRLVRPEPSGYSYCTVMVPTLTAAKARALGLADHIEAVRGAQGDTFVVNAWLGGPDAVAKLDFGSCVQAYEDVTQSRKPWRIVHPFVVASDFRFFITRTARSERPNYM